MECGVLAFNAVESAVREGEYRAARTQLLWFIRRLRTARDEWSADLAQHEPASAASD